MAKPQKLDQAQTLDQLNRYMSMASARNKDAAVRRAEWSAWYDNLGWHEKHIEPTTIVVGKACCIRFIAANGSGFGAERRTLRKGMTGDDVKTMQGIVGASPADGNFGGGTLAKVIAWQRTNGLSPDGVFGAASWAKSDSLSGGITDADRERVMGLVGLTSQQTYDSSQAQAAQDKKADVLAKSMAENVPSTAVAHPTIRLYSKGDSVKEWQKLMGVAQTGTFDAALQKVTRSFQSSHSLDADGVVGPKTWMAAYSAFSASSNIAPPGAVVDSTGTLPPALAPTTAQVLATPQGTPVMGRPVGQPIKTSAIRQVLAKAPKSAPSSATVMNAATTNGQAGSFVQTASMSYWNPLSWSTGQKVIGGLAAVAAVVIGKKEYDAGHPHNRR
jgi:peptidoglycan hydrolase-like protein with peptidoglycan-binding domain